ncbi:MAG: hypothetical protein RDU41_10225 [Clostridia bacterium]|nr:hypothetical protein [Clostridia bacterium]
MDQMPLLSLIMVSFPEAVLVTALGLVLAGYDRAGSNWYSLV